MGMTRRDYQLIAEALKAAGEIDMGPLGGTEPGATWWVTVNELITRLKADNPRFSEAIFRDAATPDSINRVVAVPGGTGTRPVLPSTWDAGTRQGYEGSVDQQVDDATTAQLREWNNECPKCGERMIDCDDGCDTCETAADDRD